MKLTDLPCCWDKKSQRKPDKEIAVFVERRRHAIVTLLEVA